MLTATYPPSRYYGFIYNQPEACSSSVLDRAAPLVGALKL